MGATSKLASTLGLVDAPEYKARLKRDFTPPTWTIQQIHAIVPKELHEKNTLKSFFYTARIIAVVYAFYKLATFIDPLAESLPQYGFSQGATSAIKWSLWSTYWIWQSFGFAGFWTLAHEAGHGALSPKKWICTAIGYPLMIFTLSPYHAWRASHNAHHKATGQMERDENYVPKTRSQYGLPPADKAKEADYTEMFEDAPIVLLYRMVVMQLLGLQLYFAFNLLGSPMYPAGTNHFNPDSALFKPEMRNGIIATDIGLGIMMSLLYNFARAYGFNAFMKYYFVSYLLCNHWIVMLTYLHHTDPTNPHYRGKQWSFVRGALGTTDRPLLGWIGRFFFHNVSHDHVAHHFFSGTPFYNQPKVTEALKNALGDEYNYDSTPIFRALYRSFTQCCFIEDEGDVIFYKNSHGKQQRRLSEKAAKELGLPQE